MVWNGACVTRDDLELVSECRPLAKTSSDADGRFTLPEAILFANADPSHRAAQSVLQVEVDRADSEAPGRHDRHDRQIFRESGDGSRQLRRQHAGNMPKRRPPRTLGVVFTERNLYG